MRTHMVASKWVAPRLLAKVMAKGKGNGEAIPVKMLAMVVPRVMDKVVGTDDDWSKYP